MPNWRWLVIAAAISVSACGVATQRDTPAVPSAVSSSPMAVDADAPREGASCPVTQPPKPSFVPPAPYPTVPPALYRDQFWYGTPALWTMLGPDGSWEGLPYGDRTYSQKVFWWRRHNDESQPQLTVTGKRIDGPAPPLVSSIANYGSRDDIGLFIVVGIGIPTPGCWEIAGHGAGADLSFVVWVPGD